MDHQAYTLQPYCILTVAERLLPIVEVQDSWTHSSSALTIARLLCQPPEVVQ